ncbi:MAG TPA: hypothetical protein VGK74_26870 [Symbiobacteriaceae bacterium]
MELDGFQLRQMPYSIVLHPVPLQKAPSLEQALAQLSGLGGSMTCVFLAISVIAPFFRTDVQIRELAPDGGIRLRQVGTDTCPAAVDRARTFAAQREFTELPDDVVNGVIPDVELDLKPRGQVTIYNCLFYDEDA